MNSQDIYKDLLLGLNKTTNETKQMAADLKSDYGLAGPEKKGPGIDFMSLMSSRKEMMKQAFLPFLTLKEILYFSTLNKAVNSIIDPNRGED